MHRVFTHVTAWPASRRLALAGAFNTALLGLIGYAFWYADWQYSLPTPRPEGFYQPPLGAHPRLPAELAAFRRPDRPLFVHFANPHCPCTEFNLDHVRQLQARFGEAVDFVAVLESASDGPEAREEFEAMHLKMPVLYDYSGEVSAALGVYGTPQAALLDAEGALYFRGNYNKSRYCVDESSEYARIALTELVAGHSAPAMPRAAEITYGCPLPKRYSRGTGAGGPSRP